MNLRKYTVAALVLSTMLLALAVSSYQAFTQRRANDSRRTALIGSSGKFGPVIETVLPPPKTDSSAVLVDLETGLAMLQPPFGYFNARADLITQWIRTNGLDISCLFCSGGASCVTYDMTIIPVERKSWDKTTEEEILANQALAPVAHAPRRLLILEHDKPDTYIFRTKEGTLGMLQLVGLGEHGRGVKIRYKLINHA